MLLIRTEDFIDAPPERVWEVLGDFARYPAWNPLLLEAKGPLEVGARVAMRAYPPGGPAWWALRFTATLVRVEPPGALEWTGGVPGVLRGRHFFQLTAEGRGTRLVHGEEFQGAATALFGRRRVASIQAAYAAMNRALAERVRG
ncbi:SRPBCC domain-containing protein [Myxococcus stipitatus]|uniref:SRPBCC domain-containing protein n=1 Tax=Myxococcus stipitatus TaxID=83455 RepID=UPI003144E8BE